MNTNYYFDINDAGIISDIGSLLSLNLERKYYRPGDLTPVTDLTSTYSIAHPTAGMFRGQLYDWPLVPKSFRDFDPKDLDISGVVRSFRFGMTMHKFTSFCERAQAQNPGFPFNIADRMSIAQHFGVPTPLLDWSRNIFAATFFAIRDVLEDESFADSLRVFIYHVVDERLLYPGIPGDVDLAHFDRSAFVKPYPIDRRIERQQGVFSFHPHPSHNTTKISANRYILEWPLIQELIVLMRGFGFTEDFFFPDYAGIARAVVSNTSL